MANVLQKTMGDLITVFHSYSGKEGDKFKLSKAELKNLLQEQLPEVLEGNKDCEEVKRIMSDLDVNKDGEVDFQEFVVLVAALTIACNEFFNEFNEFVNKPLD